MERHMKNSAKVALGLSLGYALQRILAHPKSKLNKKIPFVKYKNITLMPHVKVARKDKEIHLHHWMNVGSLYALMLLKRKKFLKSKLLHGLMIGSIVEGLTYKDRFHIIHKPLTYKEELNEKN